jgi:hypothetical protein
MTIDPRLQRILAAQRYPLLFGTISGAYLYGFPSPDSDFGLRGAHVMPLERLIGPCAELDAWRKELHRDFECALPETKLPERPDYEAANRFLIKAPRELAKTTLPMAL